MNDFHDDMEVLIKLPVDFPYADLHQIGEIIQEAHLLVPGYIPPDAGIFVPDTYLFESMVHEVKFMILPDRNLVSRMARVGMGEALDADRRLAAAVMAFAQCLDLNFEPSIAFHELAHRDGNAIAHEELRWFRYADDARPQEWIDVALGRTDRLKPAVEAPDVEAHDLAKPLRRWNRNYIIALKVAELELQPGAPIDKVMSLLDWMYTDFILAGPAALFASLYFAPSAPRKGLLKQLRSPQRERAIAGLKNAAWDITQLSEFVKAVQGVGDGKTRYILATADKGLALIAESLFHYEDTDEEASGLATRLTTWWSPNDAGRIAERFMNYASRLEEPTRRPLRQDAVNIEESIREGEEKILGWQLKGK